MEPVWDTEWDNVMVAVLDTNLVPKMGNFLPPSSQCRIVGSKNGAFNAAFLLWWLFTFQKR